MSCARGSAEAALDAGGLTSKEQADCHLAWILQRELSWPELLAVQV